MKKTSLPFAKANFTLMLVGIALILVGFLVMSMDTAEFGFGTLGLVIGPIIVLSGFVTEFFAILKK